MEKLLIATMNEGKFREAAEVFQNDTIEVVKLRDFPNISAPEETGETFEENAILKAKYYFDKIGIPCIADDGGLIIDALGGAPGVHSKRWLGREANDQELADAVIEKMKGIPREKRTARLGGYIVFYDGTHILKHENWLEGYIAEKLMDAVSPGFPYRPILMIPEFNKPYSMLTHEEHEKVNFRRKNLKALKDQILKLI